MSKAVKKLVTEELRTRYEGLNSACVVELTGMSVQAQESLRKRLRDKSARLQVVKNSLARRAFEDGPLAPLGQALEGPCALVTCSASLIDIAKVLVEAAKDFKELKLKQAIFDGDPSLVLVEELSKMKGQTGLIGEVGMLISSPGRAVAGCIGSPQAKIAGCLKALVDKAA